LKSKGLTFAAGFMFAVAVGAFSALLLDLELVAASKGVKNTLDTESAKVTTTSDSLSEGISKKRRPNSRAPETKDLDETELYESGGLPRTNNSKQADSAELHKIISNLNSNEIKLVKSWISRINEKRPRELFESEVVDPTWSTVKQSELEYSFYDNTSFGEIATLDSVNCKSSLCRVRISLYGGDKNSVHLFSAWSNPVSMHLRPHEENSESQKLEIYVARIDQ
jgi:hypothetical protein